uniref:Retrovirus-related Pol polyprotein from transposon TNT 1-94-like beta-barrel domain-containing protein n=1 Tax=Fagus sylvatica TaxID=28930 RepID=A0A2N9HUD7_FAGSY
MMCNGAFFNKDPNEAWQYFDQLAENAQSWDPSAPSENSSKTKPSTTSSGGRHHLREEDDLNARIASLARKVESMELRKVNEITPVQKEEVCGICEIMGHATHECPTIPAFKEVLHDQANAMNTYKKPFQSPYSETYNPGEKGKFPAQPQPNPQGQFGVSGSSASGTQHEHVKFITTLRSGKVIDKTIPTKAQKPEEFSKPKSDDKLDKSESSEAVKCPIPAPFPQRLQPPQKLSQNSEIFEIFKQVKINIPLLDAIKQIPSYAKFLKDLCTVKRKLNVQKKAFLCEQVSAIIQHNTPPKYKDPGCPTISGVTGNFRIEKALLDLGASVNLLPYSVYEQLGLGELKPTGIILQLADRSVKTPRGIVEDVCIQIPIILGRPFLATSNALINCRNGVMKLSFGNMTLEDQFNLTCFSDPLESCLVNSLDFDDDEDSEVAHICSVLNSSQTKIIAMEGEKMAYKMMNQDFVKLDKFDGSNFIRWQDKMKFLLTALKIFYVLDPNLQPIPDPTPEDTEQLKQQRIKREEDELVCRGHILNTLSDRLYDLYTTMTSPKEIWKALEIKYKTEKQGTDKFIIQKYFDFKMMDNVSVLDQMHELQILVHKLNDLSIKIPELFQVGAIIAKLPPSWNNYRKKLLHMAEGLTLEQIGTHLRIEEESRIREGTNSVSKVNEGTVNYVLNGGVGSSKTNKSFRPNKKIVKKTNSNKDKKGRACFHYGKKGHYIRECRFLKNQMKEKELNTSEANVVDEIVAMVSEMQIGMITEVHMVNAAENSSEWWYDSGATIHVCNNKMLFKEYVEAGNGLEVLMGNHNTAKVLGTGTVELILSSGKKVKLTNVYHVPDIKKNLVSASLLSKNGVKAVLESDKLILSKCGVFVGKGYSCNGMYKLSLIINKNDVGCAYIVDSSLLWHARLGHLNCARLAFKPLGVPSGRVIVS